MPLHASRRLGGTYALNRDLHALRGCIGVLVLPHADDLPASASQHVVNLAIPISVPAQLRHPVVTVGLRDHLVLRAVVPEAAVDEDGDSGAGEDDVGAYRPTR